MKLYEYQTSFIDPDAVFLNFFSSIITKLIEAKRTCCNIAGFVPTMDLDETSVEVSQTYASSYEHGFNLTMT